MSIGSTLFGSSPSANVSTYPTLNPDQQAALKALLNRLQAPGAGTANMAGAGTSLSALEEASRGLAGGAAASKAQGTYSDIMSRGPADIGNYFQSAVADPAMKQFKEQVIPALTAAFPGASAYGSDRGVMVDRATQDLVNSLTSNRANMAYNAYQADIQNKLSAAGGSMAGQSADINAIISALSGQMQPIQMAQQAQQYNIQDILGALGIKPFENIATVTPGQSGVAQDMASGLGTALGAYAMYAML